MLCGNRELDFWFIGSDNDLGTDGTKPLPKPMLTSHQWDPIIKSPDGISAINH